MGLALETKRPFGEQHWDWHYANEVEDAAFDFYVTHGHLRGFLHESFSVEYPFKNNGEKTTASERRTFLQSAESDYQTITENKYYHAFKSTIGSFLLNAASAGLDITPTGNVWGKFDTSHDDFLNACAAYLRTNIEKSFTDMLESLRHGLSTSAYHKNLESSLEDMSKIVGRNLELREALSTTKQEVDTRVLNAVFGMDTEMTRGLKKAVKLMSIHPQRVRDVFNAQSDERKIRIEQRLAESRIPFEKPVLNIKHKHSLDVTTTGIVGFFQRAFMRGPILRHA